MDHIIKVPPDYIVLQKYSFLKRVRLLESYFQNEHLIGNLSRHLIFICTSSNISVSNRGGSQLHKIYTKIMGSSFTTPLVNIPYSQMIQLTDTL